MSRLSAQQIDEALASLPGWATEGDALVRTVDAGSFPAAVAFVVRLAFEAEAANHHPDLDLRYSKVRVSWTSHDQGGITGSDVEMATRTNSLLGSG